MKEEEFINQLQAQVKELKLVSETGILPSWAAFLGEWLGENPWRVIGLSSSLIYGLGRLVWGDEWREMILKVFGGY